MCGRYAFFSAHEAVARLFGIQDPAPIEPRWNIAPTQFVPVVRTGSDGARRVALLYWGLIPSWAREKSIGARLINARSETARDKPAFRAAYRKRRCLLLASGYYEWQKTGGAKQPYFIRRVGGDPFGMAGLWESWIERPGEPPLESCTILTGAAQPALAVIHDRSPVIIPPESYARWLDPQLVDADAVDALVGERHADPLQAVAVGRAVNNAKNEGRGLIAPIEV
ncbi:MAG: SOS response-associated peptidase [Steroidobacteraceae bacterium]